MMSLPAMSLRLKDKVHSVYIKDFQKRYVLAPAHKA